MIRACFVLISKTCNVTTSLPAAGPPGSPINSFDIVACRVRTASATCGSDLPGNPKVLISGAISMRISRTEAKAAKAIGDISLKLEQAATTPEERAYWAEGGVGRAALHALAGGLLGGVTDVTGMIRGALGGASSALLGPHIRELVAEIVDSANVTDPALRTFLINSISSGIVEGIVEGIGAGIGGSEGAAYAGNAFQYNYLTHKELEDANQERAELLDEIAKCKASTNSSCSPTQLASLEADLNASTAFYQQLSDANNAALVTACAASFSSDACVRGRKDLQNAVDEEYGLQARVLGTGTVNTPDALLLGVLNDVAANRITPTQIASSYKQVLVRDQQVTEGAALALLAVAGIAVGPEVYTACLTNPAVCTELVGAAGELALGDALAGTAGSTLVPTVTVASGILVLREGDEIIGAVDQVTGKLVHLSDPEIAAITETLRTSEGTANAASGAKLDMTLLVDEILDHSFYKHVLQQGEFSGLGIRTSAQFRAHVENVILHPSEIRYYGNGREVYLQESTGTVVIVNRTASGQSTAFQPQNWSEYISTLPKRTTPYQ